MLHQEAIADVKSTTLLRYDRRHLNVPRHLSAFTTHGRAENSRKSQLHIHISNRETYTASAMTIDIVAIITPKAGKADRVRSASMRRTTDANIHHPGRGAPQASSAVRQGQRTGHAALPPAARNERRRARLRHARDVTPPLPPSSIQSRGVIAANMHTDTRTKRPSRHTRRARISRRWVRR
jgi:hypothetical protein